MMPLREVLYDGVTCKLVLEEFPRGVVVLRISGTDTGEFGEAPMEALAGWLNAQKEALRSVTMLTGSRFIQVTAEFVRQFASLQGIMRICSEPGVFEGALADALAGAWHA
jgi:hypothetical protein